ncbi:MAG: OmpA family protein [Gammaproteobacteria bacterium]|nr:OmpA family protein [Gammaproteobacteria bacterium]
MNTGIPGRIRNGKALGAAAALSLVLAGCASAPLPPPGAAEARSKLTRLQSDPNLATRAPTALKDAEAAVNTAELPVSKAEAELGAHRVYIADRKVEIAMAQASTRYAEDQRAKFASERDKARLDARTQEADAAKLDASRARSEADAAAGKAAELQRQIAALEAEATDRGLVLTLGDVLFATGKSEVKVGAMSNLNKLVVFLNSYPERSVQIEGHTDSVGSEDSNQGLSQRRAESVRAYLVQQGIAANRLTAVGLGENQPVASNDTQSGRQQNRRVVAIIDNPAPATASSK